jgi:hypothetical protein
MHVVYTYVCAFLFASVCVFVCVCACVFMCIFMYGCICICMYKCVCVCVTSCMFVYSYRVHACRKTTKRHSSLPTYVDQFIHLVVGLVRSVRWADKVLGRQEWNTDTLLPCQRHVQRHIQYRNSCPKVVYSSASDESENSRVRSSIFVLVIAY